MKQLLAVLIAVSATLGAQQAGRAIVVQMPPPLNISSDRTFQTGHTGRVTALAFMPDGRLLSAGADRMFRLWDSRSGIQLAAFESGFTGDNDIGTLAFDRTGRYLVTASSNAVQLWEFETWRRIWSVDPAMSDVNLAAFAADGRTITVSAIEGDIDFRRISKQFDAVTGRVLRTRDEAVRADAVNPGIVAFSPDRSVNAVTSDENIILKDSKGRPLHVLTRQRGVAALAFSLDGKLLASGSNGAGDGALKIWDVSTGRELKILDDERQWVLSLAFSPNGLFLAAGGQGVRILNVQSGLQIRQLEDAKDTVASVAFSPDGTKLASAGRNLNIWDVATGAAVFTIPNNRFVQVVFSPDGRLLAAAGMSGPITIYAVATGQVIRTLLSPAGLPSTLEFSPDSLRLAFGTRAMLSVTVDPNTRRPVIAPTAPDSAAVVVWNTNTGQQLYAIPARDWVSKLTFTSDSGGLIAAFGTMNQSGTVKLWDAQNGREVRTLLEQTDAYKAAAFSPDRAWIAGGPNDVSGAIQLWRLMR